MLLVIHIALQNTRRPAQGSPRRTMLGQKLAVSFQAVQWIVGSGRHHNLDHDPSWMTREVRGEFRGYTARELPSPA